MNPYHHAKKVTCGTRRCCSPDSPKIPAGVINATTTAETTSDRSTKKAKLDDEYDLRLSQALRTLAPIPVNCKPRKLCNPPLNQIMVKQMVARVGEYLLTFQTEEDTTKTKHLDLDQLIHELDNTSNFLKNLTKRQVIQGLQTSLIEVPPVLVTPKPLNLAPRRTSSTPLSTTSPPNRKSFAAAVAGKTKPPTPHHQAKTKPDSGIKPNHASHQNDRRSRRADSKHFVIDLHSCACRQLPIHEIQDAMNSIMECTSARVAAVKYTDNGNLVVSVVPANAANELASPHRWLQISKYIHDNLLQHEPPEPISIYPDSSWHRVVVNGIPIPEPLAGRMTSEVMDSVLADWDKFNPVAAHVPRHAKSRIRILAPAGKVFGPSDSLSICFAFPEAKAAKHAHRLLREGAFIHSTHCRSSIYKSKRSNVFQGDFDHAVKR